MRESFRKIQKRCSDTHGFTLTELLATMLLVSMMSAAVAGGAAVVQRSLERISLQANSELLLSMTVERMKDELRYAEDVRVDSDGVLLGYRSGSDGGERRFENAPGQKGIALRYSAAAPPLGMAGTEGNRILGERELLLVGQSARTEELYAVLGSGTEGISYERSANCFTIGQITVYRRNDGNGEPLSELRDVKISPVNRSAFLTEG